MTRVLETVPVERVELLASALEEARALEIVILQMARRLPLCDFFVICHSRSPVHGEAILEKVQEQMSQAGIRPRHREGGQQGEWIVLDYGDIVLHVFSEQARAFYALERLWAETPRLPWPPAPAAADPPEAGGAQ